MKKFLIICGLSLSLIGCGKQMPDNIPDRPDNRLRVGREASPGDVCDTLLDVQAEHQTSAT